MKLNLSFTREVFKKITQTGLVDRKKHVIDVKWVSTVQPSWSRNVEITFRGYLSV